MSILKIKDENNNFVDIPTIKGATGFSPTVTTSKTGKVTTITITDLNGVHTATINDGDAGTDIVNDVKVNGTTVVDSNKVANIDLSTYSLVTETGNKIDLSLNSSTYVMTLTLKDKNNNVLSTGTIDLPLESVVVNGSYDSTNKKVILTLQSGSTIEFSVADLISGLQSEITSSNKLSSDLVDDSSATNKFVTASEKTTWSGKQDALVSGTNLKTINSTSLLGSGDIEIEGEKYFLGSTRTFTQSNPLDLDTLETNKVYTIKYDQYYSLYVTASYDGTALPISSISFTDLNDGFCTLLYIKPVRTDKTSYIHYGTIDYGKIKETTREMIYNKKQIKLYPTYIDSSSGSFQKITAVSTDGVQTITGVKTFSVLPESSVTPTSNNQLTNKSYVDSAISAAISTTLGGIY